MANIPDIIQNQSLKLYNTFGIDVFARYFTEAHTVALLSSLIKDIEWKHHPKFILGGGSNILFTQNFNGLMIKNNIKGIEKIRENDDHVWLQVGAGEIWHEFVMHCIANNYAGVENLSLIPGSTGAAPVQNIGAYGVEIKEILEELTAVSLVDGTTRIFKHHECQFGYRDSIFKHAVKNQFVIANVTLRLNKKPNFNVTYGAIQETLQAMNIKELSIRAVSDAVIHIRRNKLPDPKIIGNAGSFFKNPVVSHEQFIKLQNQFPNIPHYKSEGDDVKIAAAWLIEQCGWKGKSLNGAGVHDKQALVIVNHGSAQGAHIKYLADAIMASVLETFEIQLQCEVQII